MSRIRLQSDRPNSFRTLDRRAAGQPPSPGATGMAAERDLSGDRRIAAALDALEVRLMGKTIDQCGLRCQEVGNE